MQLKLGHESHLCMLSMKFDVSLLLILEIIQWNILLILEIMQGSNFWNLKTMQGSSTLELHTKTSQG